MWIVSKDFDGLEQKHNFEDLLFVNIISGKLAKVSWDFVVVLGTKHIPQVCVFGGTKSKCLELSDHIYDTYMSGEKYLSIESWKNANVNS